MKNSLRAVSHVSAHTPNKTVRRIKGRIKRAIPLIRTHNGALIFVTMRVSNEDRSTRAAIFERDAHGTCH